MLALLTVAALILAALAGLALALQRSVAGGTLARLERAIEELARAQLELRREVQQGREAALVGVAGATQDLQARLSQAQRTLAEVKAIEQARGSQLDRAADSIRRLELIVAGSSTRGAAGESMLARSLTQLPPDLLETNAAFGGRVVEYALRLPGGRLLPIDSKWTSVALLEALDGAGDAAEQRRVREQLTRDLRLRVRELTRYLDPDRTLSLAVLALPDAVHAAVPEVQAEGWREGVLVVPYSLALPFVLSLYRLAVRFGGTLDAAESARRLADVAEALRRLDEEVEGRLSRALAQAANARDALRGEVADARRVVERVNRVEV